LASGVTFAADKADKGGKADRGAATGAQGAAADDLSRFDLTSQRMQVVIQSWP
jgi:hypothetical protein